MSEQIHTAAELDALPVGSVVLDRHGYPWRKGTGSWVCTSDGGVIEPHEVTPLTVLHRPDAPVTAGATVTREQRDEAIRAATRAVAKQSHQWPGDGLLHDVPPVEAADAAVRVALESLGLTVVDGPTEGGA